MSHDHYKKDISHLKTIDDETLVDKFDSFHNRGDDKSRYEFGEDCPF